MSKRYYEIVPIGRKSVVLTYHSYEQLEALEECKQAQLVQIPIRSSEPNALGYVLREVCKPKFQTKSALPSLFYYSSSQVSLALFMAQYYLSPLPKVLDQFMPLKMALRSSSKMDFSYKGSTLSALNSSQEHALRFIRDKPISLLFGDTGSGKSEVYFHLMDEVLEKNQKVLFLMPEIALTPQMERRIKGAFSDYEVGIWHSKVTNAKKRKIQDKLQRNEIQILAGTRSAVFADLENLGLIIVDEEHDDSYKAGNLLGVSNNTPYNARDICIYLAKTHNIQLLLGSATPSVQSYYLAKENGWLYRLRGRFHQTQKKITFVEKNGEFLSDKSINALENIIDSKKQALVFVPIRAHFKRLVCGACGECVKCKNCSVCLSLHEDKMLCHYCGYSERIPSECKSCKESDLRGHQAGSMQLSAQIRERLPRARVGVFDTDHVKSQEEIRNVLLAFENGDLDILVGTQMISKGHDYDIALAIIFGIDHMIGIANYRALERGFSVLYQINGRSARKSDGEIIIESNHTELISEFIDDYGDFLEFDLKNRAGLYPPFCKLVALHFFDKSEPNAQKKLQDALIFLNKKLSIREFEGDNAPFEIIGHGASPILRVDKMYRYHIFLRTFAHIKTLKILQILKGQMDVYIDVDPVGI